MPITPTTTQAIDTGRLPPDDFSYWLLPDDVREARSEANRAALIASVEAGMTRRFRSIVKRRARDFLATPAHLDMLASDLSTMPPREGLAIVEAAMDRLPRLRGLVDTVRLNHAGARLALRWLRRRDEGEVL